MILESLFRGYNLPSANGGDIMRGKREDTKSVRQQGLELLDAMFRKGKGTSKHKDKACDPVALAQKIYSDTTLHTYKQAWLDYCEKMKEAKFKVNGHSPRTLDEAREFMPFYVDDNKRRPGKTAGSTMSAWSQRTYFAGAAKVLGCSASDYDLPSRNYTNIKRSREIVKSDSHFSADKNAELLSFARSTGLRNAKELQQITGKDLVALGGGEYAIHVRGKGGKERQAPVVGTPGEIAAVVNRMIAAGSGCVWVKVPKHADIHACRREYAQRIYSKYARPVESIPRSERYYCRGGSTAVFDRKAMLTASKALGHSRLNVIAGHYLDR